MWMSNDCLSIVEANDDLIILKRHQQRHERQLRWLIHVLGKDLVWISNSNRFNPSLSTFLFSAYSSDSREWHDVDIFWYYSRVHNETRHDTKLHYHSSFVLHKRDKNKIEQIKTQVFYTSWRNKFPSDNLIYLSITLLLNKFWFYWSPLYWVNIEKFTFEMMWWQLKIFNFELKNLNGNTTDGRR